MNYKALESRLKADFADSNISYYRTDGISHSSIKILNEQKVSALIKKAMLEKNEYYEENGIVFGDEMMVAKALKVGTPSSIFYLLEEKDKNLEQKKDLIKDLDIFYNLRKKTKFPKKIVKLKKDILKNLLNELNIDKASPSFQKIIENNHKLNFKI